MVEYRGYLILTHAPCCCCWELKREEHFEFWLLRSTYLAFVCIVLLSSLFHANCLVSTVVWTIFGSQFSWAWCSISFHIFPLAPEVASCFQIRCEAVALVLRGGIVWDIVQPRAQWRSISLSSQEPNGEVVDFPPMAIQGRPGSCEMVHIGASWWIISYFLKSSNKCSLKMSINIP